MIEIERRWLVTSPPLAELKDVPSFKIEQVYLAPKAGAIGIVRARSKEATDLSNIECFLTVKMAMTAMANFEVEDEISEDMFDALKKHADRIITKTRYEIEWDDSTDPALVVELDHFGGDLWIAEVELQSEGQAFEPPEWFGKEITGNRDFSNYNMSVPI